MDSRKELIRQYKNRKQTGGVFAIKNKLSDKWYVDFASDLKAAENRFGFMPDSFLKIAGDFRTQNGNGFVFEILEELEKSELMSEEQFLSDLALLKEIWLEKLSGRALY